MTDDPVVARLLRSGAGLTAGDVWAGHDVLATYWTTDGRALFAICREGLLLEPSDEGRFVPFTSISNAGYYNREMIMRAKSAKVAGEKSATLSIGLADGEFIHLPLGVHKSGIPHLLSIARLIEQRVRIARAALREKA
jgi:hypothetical protein